MLSKNFKKLVYEIKVLNPDAEIRMGNPQFDELAEFRIFSSVDVNDLKLPQDCYIDKTNSIQYKNVDAYFRQKILVFPVNQMDLGKTFPDLSWCEIEEFLSEKKPVSNISEIAYMLQRLNPEVKITTDNKNIYYEGVTSIRDLVLPGCINFIQDSDQFCYTWPNEKEQRFYILPTIRNHVPYNGHEVYNLNYDKASQYMVDRMKADYEKLEKLKPIIKSSVYFTVLFELAIGVSYYKELVTAPIEEYLKEIFSRGSEWENLINHFDKIGFAGSLLSVLELISAGVALVAIPKYIIERVNFKYDYGHKPPKSTEELQKLSRTLNQPRKK